MKDNSLFGIKLLKSYPLQSYPTLETPPPLPQLYIFLYIFFLVLEYKMCSYVQTYSYVSKYARLHIGMYAHIYSRI
jgi:hypothetical protein